MATIDVSIVVNRAAAILAGHTDHGICTVPLDLDTCSETERKLLALAAKNSRDNAPVDLSGNNLKVGDVTEARVNYPEVATADAGSVHTILAAWQAQRAAHEAKLAEEQAHREALYAKACAEWLKLPDDDLLRQTAWPSHELWEVVQPTSNAAPFGGAIPDENLPEPVKQRIARLQSIVEQRNAELEASRIEEKQRQIKEKEAAEKRRHKLLDEIVQNLGTESQRKRHQRSMLPEKEIIRLYRNQVFAPLDEARIERYKRITPDDVLEAAGVGDFESDDNDVEFDVEAVSEADATAFAALETMEQIVAAKLPPGTVCTLRDHMGGLKRHSTWDIQRRSILVTVPGDIEVSREYACP